MNARVLSALLRTDFLSFVWKCFNTAARDATYVDNWHIEALAYHLMQVQEGKIQRLLVNMPPRADSDDLARVYRFDLAQDSEMISPTIPI